MGAGGGGMLRRCTFEIPARVHVPGGQCCVSWAKVSMVLVANQTRKSLTK